MPKLVDRILSELGSGFSFLILGPVSEESGSWSSSGSQVNSSAPPASPLRWCSFVTQLLTYDISPKHLDLECPDDTNLTILLGGDAFVTTSLWVRWVPEC